MKTKTELDMDFEYKDDRDFTIRIFIVALSAFVLGMAIATGLIAVCLSLTDSL